MLEATNRPQLARVSVTKVDLSRLDADDWNDHAMGCQASLRSAYAHLRHIGLRHILRGVPCIYQVMYEAGGKPERIGHYTLIRGAKLNKFYDGIILSPEYRHLWAEAMEAALAEAGRGIFDYGWQWFPEPARDAELVTIPGVKLLSTRPILIQGVDFANWPDWESYYRDISENIRRNAKKAVKLHPDLDIAVSSGLKSLRRVIDLVRMRGTMYRRKGMPFHPIRMFAGYILNFLTCPEQAMIAMAVSSNRILAIQNIVEFGSTHYYLDGAAATDTDGGAWNLQLAMLKRAYDRFPAGRFLLGYTDLPVADQSAEGLLRSRRSLRASEWPTSLVRFEWTPSCP